jgi:hypothetical protein
MAATTTTATTAFDLRTSSTAPAAATSRLPLLRAGVVSGAVAAVATTVLAVAARAVDIPLTVGGEAIHLLGFAQLTLVGALLGVAIARACARWARRPRHAFLVTTVALTTLSLVPDVLADASAGSRVVLALTHVVAAAIVVPALAKRLAR